VLINSERVITYVNNQIVKLTEYRVDELLGTQVGDLFSTEEQKKIVSAVNKVLTEELVSVRTSSFLTTKSGRTAHFIANSNFIRLKGKPYVLAIVRDMSDHQHVLEDLKVSRKTFENIFNSTFVPKFVINKKGDLIKLNKSALKLFGEENQQNLLQHPFTSLFVEERCDIKAINKAMKLAFKSAPQQFEVWVKQAEGDVSPKLVIIEKSIYFGEKVLFAYFVDIEISTPS